MPKPPWKPERQGVASVIDHWLTRGEVRDCFVLDDARTKKGAAYAPMPEWVARPIVDALHARGISSLYAHQAQALEYARSKRAVLVATPTASGKSLCFHLPVLQALLERPTARAMYLYPTKALSRDQETSVRELMQSAGIAAGAITYDGDTPADARRSARERSGIIMTNPDMLHTGILPHHTKFARLFQALEYIVVDEMHTYRGVFGSHVANVMARLLRVAAFHGAAPKILSATATIGNPLEHASRLFGFREADIGVVEESGAPHSARRLFVYNPPVVNAELGMRASYIKRAVSLTADLVRANVPTIVFGSSRNNVEVMLRYLRESVSGVVDSSRIMAYRGGYLPAQRRDIEAKLRSGEILAVVATSALELGIDIGELSAVVCAGYPGTVASLLQRFGRAGRRGDLCVSVLVTTSAPLDQYLANDPDFLRGGSPENARIDPSNAEILVQHVKCAAFELPFRRGESFGELPAEDTEEVLRFLQKHAVVHESGGTFHWASDSYPANNVSLRSVGWDNVVIIDVGENKTIAEIDFRGAHTMVHEQAIYQHDGETFQVERFDYDNHKAFVRKVVPDYYTDAMVYAEISVLEVEGQGELSAWRAGFGEVSVVEKVVGYKKIKFYTHENAGYGDVHLPEMQLHTMAFWLTVPLPLCERIPGGRVAAVDALRGIGHCLEAVSALALMCEPRDLGMTLGDTDGDDEGSRATKGVGGPRPGYAPTLFLYEHVPGGTGLSERIFERRDELLLRAQRLLVGCACPSGCPSCVGPVDTALAQPTRKESAKALLAALLPAA